MCTTLVSHMAQQVHTSTLCVRPTVLQCWCVVGLYFVGGSGRTAAMRSEKRVTFDPSAAIFLDPGTLLVESIFYLGYEYDANLIFPFF